MLIIRQKEYSKYDRTDELKRMTDADILDEKEQDTVNRLNVPVKIGVGVAGGMAANAGLKTLGTLRDYKKGKISGHRISFKLPKNTKGIENGIKNISVSKVLKKGGVAGGLIGAAVGLSQNRKRRKEDEFYNDRLEYAKSKAKKRERQDWKANMNQRDNYSY